MTNKLVESGDILSLNTFPMIFGYYTALERTLFCGHVTSDEHLRLWEVNVEVHERGLELIQPNARCCDIAAELNDIYRSYDLLKYRSFGYGHSFGVLSHYYGREAGVELREDVETVLEPGMVVSMEPMIAIPAGQPGSGGYREHDILIFGVMMVLRTSLASPTVPSTTSSGAKPLPGVPVARSSPYGRLLRATRPVSLDGWKSDRPGTVDQPPAVVVVSTGASVVVVSAGVSVVASSAAASPSQQQEIT
ncbi:MAG: hypothetical protein Ct9H300mP12_10630 [Acidimicrobiales bacterium]|nr:MAG: hypothetical protein Ct9H300mP12_10630 [Acidimicrobiales bacterium]